MARPLTTLLTAAAAAVLVAGAADAAGAGHARGAVRAIAFARAQLGKPYLWGGTGPGAFDCSGLVQQAWRAAGVKIPRTSQEQWKALHHVGRPRPGDLGFWAGADGTVAEPGHVVIYIGHGRVIQAPHQGASVEITPLSAMGSGFTGWAEP